MLGRHAALSTFFVIMLLKRLTLPDAFAAVGLVYLVLGLLRLADRLGGYSMLHYGLYRAAELMSIKGHLTAEPKCRTYADYTSVHRFSNNSCSGFLAIAVTLLLSAILVGGH